MASLTLKNIPDDLYESIKRNAAENRRSINSEIIVRLERSLKARRVDPEAFLARVDRLRDRIGLPPLTDEILQEAREEGRP